jgi:hypothetical protein
VLLSPTRQTGFAVLGLPVGEKVPLLHCENVKPDTLPAVSLSDWPASAPAGTAVPLPPSVARIVSDDGLPAAAPVQLDDAKRAQVTEAEGTPMVLIFTFPSVNVVVAMRPDAPVACTP